VDLGLGIVGNPELLLLDEPTTGFDPAARRAAWETIELLCAGGMTVVLTTHYLEEAERLADRVVVVVVGGRVVADGPGGRRCAGKRVGDAQDRRSCADARGVARLGSGAEANPGPADGEPIHPRGRLHGTHRRQGQRREAS
jgi:ABC-type multidrug transport system ATPase subunit